MQQLLTQKAAEIVNLLNKKNMTVATAESCTGGLLSALITSVSGASAVFGLGVCSYSADAKINVLGVEGQTVEKYGTVSEFTAMEMAESVRRLANADFGLSVTGCAGPSPTENKPVGRVYIALSDKNKTIYKELNIENNGRDYIRYSTASEIFDLMINHLKLEEN